MLSINVNIGLFVYAILLRDGKRDFLQFLQKILHLLLKVCVLLRKENNNRAFYFKLKALSTNDKIIP